MTGLKFGIVNNIDPETGRVRVQFPADDITSHWIPVLVMGALQNKFFHTFDINEPVACLMDENCENGVCLGAIYGNAVKPDGGTADKLRVKFSDNTVIEYDRNTSTLTVDVSGTKIIVGSAGIEISKAGDSLGSILNDWITQDEVQTHLSAAPGVQTGPPVNLPAYTAIKARINLLLS
jgi:phage baseplate assembly protein V